MGDVAPLTAKEEALYEGIDFELEPYKEEIGVAGVSDETIQADKKALLMARWRYPSLSIHGIEGAFSEPGAKTVIPRLVKGKFSIRLVPDMTPERTNAVVEAHLRAEFAKLGSPNKLTVAPLHGGPSWLAETDHPNYVAGARAIHKVFGEAPDLTREGGSIPIANWLQDATGMNVMLLPTGACDDGAHAQNEKYDRINYIRGIKVLTTYIHEIGKLVGPKPSSCRCLPPTPEALAVVGAFAKGFRCKCEI